MTQALTSWDIVTLVIAVLFVVIFSVIKIKGLISPSSGGCGNCSGGACNAPLTKKRIENNTKVNIVSVASIQQNFNSKTNKVCNKI